MTGIELKMYLLFTILVVFHCIVIFKIDNFQNTQRQLIYTVIE